MKGKLLYLTMLVAALVSTTGCKDSTAGLTYITYYPVIELKGETSIEHNKSTEFVDPGFTATINGEDVSDQVDISSDLDVSKTGIYTIGYTIVNADGFAASASRTIFVYDFDDPVIGVYTIDLEGCYRDYNGKTYYEKSRQIKVRSNNDGTYTIDDMFGGWFVDDYGDGGKMEAVISINEDGTLKLLSSNAPKWNTNINFLTENSKYDAATHSFFWGADYTKNHAVYYITMHKNTNP